MFFFVVKTDLDFIQSLRLWLYKSGYTMHRMFLEIYMARERNYVYQKITSRKRLKIQFRPLY